MPNSGIKKMTNQDMLTRLREYRSFLEAEYNTWEDMRTGKTKGLFGPHSCDAKADSYMIAQKRLEEMFPELIAELTTSSEGEQK